MPLYDLAVTLSELEGRLRYRDLREALLERYGRERSLPDGYHRPLAALILLRRLQLLLWILQSRHHSAFRRRWKDWATEHVAAIGAALAELS